jgi:hypothetical protein
VLNLESAFQFLSTLVKFHYDAIPLMHCLKPTFSLLIFRAVSLPWDLAPSLEADREWMLGVYCIPTVIDTIATVNSV